MSYLTYQGKRVQQNHKYLTNSISFPSEILIGTQIWKTKNVSIDIDAGGPDPNVGQSKVYDNDEANRALYGCLYTQDMLPYIETAFPGWRIPSQSDFQTLFDYLDISGTTSAGQMKEMGLTYWDSPNTGATNSSGFSARGGGYYLPPMSSFSYIKQIGYFRCGGPGFELAILQYGSAGYTFDLFPVSSSMYSVRLIKN